MPGCFKSGVFSIFGYYRFLVIGFATRSIPLGFVVVSDLVGIIFANWRLFLFLGHRDWLFILLGRLVEFGVRLLAMFLGNKGWKFVGFWTSNWRLKLVLRLGLFLIIRFFRCFLCHEPSKDLYFSRSISTYCSTPLLVNHSLVLKLSKNKCSAETGSLLVYV